MKAAPKLPRVARRLRTYAEFESYLVDFSEGRYPFLWIHGRPGLAKTESIKRVVRGKQVYYRKGGQLTPAQFYVDCYHHRGQPVLLDDAEHLLDNNIGAKLVSALGDTGSTKQLNWGTTSKVLGDAPPLYYTTSPLCIISNKLTSDEAIQSRAIILCFDPTNAEVHKAAALWFWDQEIYDFVGSHLSQLRAIEARCFVHADRDKRAQRDWKRLLLEAFGINRAEIAVQSLETDPCYPTREKKAQRFVELMRATGAGKGASRATYFRLHARLRQEDRLTPKPAPRVILVRQRPPAPPSQFEADALASRGPTEEESQPEITPDLPTRAAFVQPITGFAPGQTRQPASPAPALLDDTVGWEEPPSEDEDETGNP